MARLLGSIASAGPNLRERFEAVGLEQRFTEG
jgi:hypothetical protein